MATPTQKLAVALAFVAAALSLAAVAIGYVRHGDILVTPLGGGMVMLVFAVTGYLRIKAAAAPPPASDPRQHKS